MTYIINTYSGKENIMRALKIISYILVIIGALNWGLVGLFNIDLVALIFGEMTILGKNCLYSCGYFCNYITYYQLQRYY